MLTAERLRECLIYDADTGVFRWRKPTSVRVKAGEIAGRMHSGGYRVISLDRRAYFAHRLAWLYIHGAWPTHEIDHVTRDGLDNRIVNLREARRQENAANRKVRAGVTALCGVRPRRGRFQAAIRVNKRYRHLGTYDTALEAHAAYVAEHVRLYGEFSSADTLVSVARVRAGEGV